MNIVTKRKLKLLFKFSPEIDIYKNVLVQLVGLLLIFMLRISGTTYRPVCLQYDCRHNECVSKFVSILKFCIHLLKILEKDYNNFFLFKAQAYD